MKVGRIIIKLKEKRDGSSLGEMYVSPVEEKDQKKSPMGPG